MTRILAMVMLVGLCSLSAWTQEPARTMTMMVPAEIKWGPGPAFLPPGANAAVLYGDPAKQGLFVIRLKAAAGYKIPPHFHSMDEVMTVVSGAAAMGMGDTMDPNTARNLPAGSFSVIPARGHHSLTARTALVVQVQGMGPLDITYLDPNDDPRKNTTSTGRTHGR
jgi:mannose-6-phosphate isomerase-like protein (cupin superfamily)